LTRVGTSADEALRRRGVSRVGVIAGTGFVPPAGERVLVETPFGDVEVFHEHGRFVLPRHGTAAAPAHRVNHKANVEALARCRVDAIVAINSVGALVEGVKPGALLVPDDYLDFRGASLSFHDDAAVHVDVSETRAEVRALASLGGHVVGMTGCPEAALAREKGLCYASLCMVTNFAPGVGGARVSAQGIRAEAAKLSDLAGRVALRAAQGVQTPRPCACGRALDDARL
jgi:5'-methylthioadenosine phosphorylase